MEKLNTKRFKEQSKPFSVDATFYDEPEFNVRIIIPDALKNLWENKKVLYNVNMPYDDYVGPELFVDNTSLFIDADAARKSHKFMDENRNLIDENYGDLPDTIYAMYEGEFDDEYSFITCENEYFESPEEFEDGSWRLDWYGCDQSEFDMNYMDYFGEFPEDSFMSEYEDEDDDYDEDEEDEEDDDEWEESVKNHHNKKHVREFYEDEDEEEYLDAETIRKWYPWRDPESDYYEGEKEEDPETIKKWYPWRDPESEYYEGDDGTEFDEKVKKTATDILKGRKKFFKENSALSRDLKKLL